MKTDPSETCSEPMPGAAMVAAYLAEHPEFFHQHPELLATLRLPHASGQAVSLWERQVERLRHDLAELRAQQVALIENAQHNAALMTNIHGLVLELIAAAGPAEVAGLLGQRLARDFGAEHVTLLVFADGAQPDAAFVGRGSPCQSPFANLLAQRAALCGRLTQAQREALLGAGTPEGSHVVLPLGDGHWQGLLAASSDNPRRFEAGMGTDFLLFLRDVLTRVLARWVASP